MEPRIARPSLRGPFATFAGLAALWCLAAGCAPLQAPDPLAHPGVAALLAARPGPLPLGLGVFARAGDLGEGEEPHGLVFGGDPWATRRETAALLARAGLFARVEELHPRGGGEEDSRARAKASGLDLLLVLDPRGGRAAYVGRNALWWPSLALWLLAWVPSFMVRDEDFLVETALGAELVEVSSGRTVWRGSFRGSVETGLNDLERGFHLLGIFRVPWCLTPSDYRGVRRHLEPLAMSALHVNLLLSMIPSLPSAAGARGEGPAGEGR